ncbi:non-ribosomal peptide synthetase, partial [Pseudoalteromonas luteoviolacea]|uniref:non-ribosomal peptide synthetase n=1 Tax=Pseudoalteromonas luteoviolacea TaxID=43657 RepID=UPI001F2137CC
NQLAHYLREVHLVGPDVLVGLCIERSFDMFVAILGILKAGGAYVPLDPNYPTSRLEYMASDAKLALVMSSSSVASRLPKGDYTSVLLDDADLISELALQSDICISDDQTGMMSDSLAYVIYTSGSTGQPKGVMLEHRGAVNMTLAQQQLFAVQLDSRVLQFASMSFDASVSEWMMALLSGASLHLVSDEVKASPELLLDYLQQEGITHATLPPAYFRHFDTKAQLPLQCLILAGEDFELDVVAPWLDKVHIFNAYGPSEGTVCATVKALHKEHKVLGIGHPIANVQVYVLDEQQQLLPQGVAGELYIGGVGLARGYLNKPELTASKFIDNPFYDASSTNSSPRLYRTGDIVRFLADGNLAFIGRVDDQVNIRGFRIELDEVTCRLNQCDSVHSALVLAHGQSIEQQLVAYVKPQKTETGNKWLLDIKTYLNEKLPNYMVPSVVLPVDEWPLTANGKIDHNSLPTLESRHLEGHYVPPETDTQKVLVTIWADLLKLDPSSISITANFFELGGHSLLSVR